MTAPIIPARLTDDALVISDEFTWGKIGRHDVTWRIAAIEDGALVAITVSTIAERPFASNGAAWAKSDLRTWLNGPFLADVLGEGASDALLSATKEDDCVFVLSVEQARAYFVRDELRAAEGANHNWWLRDVGGAEGLQAYVHSNGWINEYGAEAQVSFASVRPAVKIALDKVQFAFQGEAAEGEPSFSSGSSLLDGTTLTLASDFGEALMLEVLESGDVFALEGFVRQFGVHESWETMMVDFLGELAAAGDSLGVTRLIDMCDGVEFMGSALVQAMVCGHTAVAATLMRAAARLDGSLVKVHLVGDTPELRQARKASYSTEAQLCAAIVGSEEGPYVVTSLMRQGLISGRNYHALLRAAGKDEDAQDLFEWMLCPDKDPLPHVFAGLVKKRVCVIDHYQPHYVPVSEWAIQMLWYPGLIQDNPETVRAMASYLKGSELEGKRQLACFLAQTCSQAELQALLARKRVFSPKDIAAAAVAAEEVGRTRIAGFLRDFLRSIGAGKLAQKDQQ